MFILAIPTLCVGFIIPLFITYYALRLGDVNQTKKWLTYWLIVAILLQLELIMKPLISLIPLFDLLKLALYVWLMHPKTMGAQRMYSTLIEPTLASKRELLDTILAKFSMFFNGGGEPVPPRTPSRHSSESYSYASAQGLASSAGSLASLYLPKRGQDYLMSWGFDVRRVSGRRSPEEDYDIVDKDEGLKRK